MISPRILDPNCGHKNCHPRKERDEGGHLVLGKEAPLKIPNPVNLEVATWLTTIGSDGAMNQDLLEYFLFVYTKVMAQ